MDESIIFELRYFTAAILCGAALALCYDFIRIFRRIVKHGAIIMAIEDIIFWIAAAFIMFGVVLFTNNGDVRWYAVAGMFMGMLIYIFTLSRAIVWVFAKILKKVNNIFVFILKKMYNIVKIVYIKTLGRLIKKLKAGKKSIGKKKKKKTIE